MFKTRTSQFLSSVWQNSLLHRQCLKSARVRKAGTYNTTETNEEGLACQFRDVMRNVPQPVVVVTTSKYNKKKKEWLKRGVTCSSFTSVSLKPPMISFAMNRPSRMHNIMLDTEKFVVHVLGNNQVGYGLHFAKPAEDDRDQFDDIPHDLNSSNLPVILDTCAVLECNFHSVNTIGDHHVWYGEVDHCFTNEAAAQPMLYYMKSFRSVTDQTYIQQFEDRTLPFEEWTHEAHLRMAWYYIKEHGRDEAIPLIKTGIKSYNEVNKDKISRGYHETVTMFYAHSIAYAILHGHNQDTFEEFIEENSHLLQKDLLFQYYSSNVITNKDSAHRFVPPDKKALPGM